MAVKIRLKRLGQKKSPFYRIVVADERSPRDGRNIAEIGTYDPNQEPCVVKVDEEAAKKWLQNGAQPTDVVARLFKQAGIEKLVEVIASALVDSPEDVVVTETEDEKQIVLNLTVAPEDMGKVIGKQGRIAKAIRTVVRAAGSKGDKKIMVDIQ